MDFVDQTYWDSSYDGIKFNTLTNNDPLRKWLASYVKKGKGSCLEIGCFPGGILSFFGELGYTLNGVDLTPRVEKDLPSWLRQKGYQVGKFTRKDFLQFPTDRKYNIVSSFGFIEHFSDWQNILTRHTKLVQAGGLLIIEAPNFRGIVQKILRTWLDKKNYRRHNIESMQPRLWGQIVQEQGFEIIFCGYFANFMFWVDDEHRNWLQKMTINLIQSSTKRFLKYLPSVGAYAPFCGLICKKL